jgi:TolB-like protein/Flp pilus assembly protein TadD
VSVPPKAIFLSYASQDAEVARRLCDALRAVGLDVWFDQSALRGGDAWDASIRRQIKECALFVPVISANTQVREEGYFRLEWKLAVDRSHLMADDKAFLLPVVIDATIDANARVPEKFREVQWTHLPAGEASAAFAEWVQRLLSGGAASAMPVAPSRVVPASAPAAAAPAHEAPSIAVLPFVNRSRDEEDEYFSDGLADELLNVLAKIRGLRVAARTSAFQFKGKNDDIAVIGRKLNVATVLEGSVRKAGNRMRISVQLVKVADGYHLWSETYDRTLEDIFAVQDDIAHSVVKELRTTLLGEAADATAQVAAAMKGRADNPEAHRLYLQGRFFLERVTEADVARAVEYLDKATALDPEFALGWAGLARACHLQAAWGWAPFAAGFARAREAAQRALALSPDLAEAHVCLGLVFERGDWDLQAADAEFRRAFELAPGNVDVLKARAGLAGILGRHDEAIELLQNAAALDPLGTSTLRALGGNYSSVDRFDEAEAALRAALDLNPKAGVVHSALSHLRLKQGRPEEALAEASLEPHPVLRLADTAMARHALGQAAESDAALSELIADHAEIAAYDIAQVCAVRGEVDRAFHWLERGYAQRDSGMPLVANDRLLEPLHGDPRWDPLLRKVGLAD